jgi:outer membrane protein
MSEGGLGTAEPAKLLRRGVRVSVAAALGVMAAHHAAMASGSSRQPGNAGDAARQYDIVAELGAGGAMRPAYDGASDYKFGPTGFFTLHYLWLPGFGTVKKERSGEGLSVGPSFRYVYKRDSADHPELRGLDNVNAAFELGGRLAYQWQMFRPWLAVRYGLGGHNGVVAETGLDLRFRPTAVTEFAIGPRASFATGEYMRTYFGVTAAESARSGLRTHDPRGGIKGAGAEISGRYEFTPQWALLSSVTYERLVGDAASSPIVKLGSADQITARLGVSYKFGLKLFSN